MSESEPQLWRRAGIVLQPANDAAVSALRSVKPGGIVATRIRHPRNIGHHRKYWALVRAFARGAGIDDVEVAHRVIKALAGYMVEVKVGDHTVVVERSISFSSMSQDAFDAFYECAVNAVVRALGTTHEELAEQIAVEF